MAYVNGMKLEDQLWQVCLHLAEEHLPDGTGEQRYHFIRNNLWLVVVHMADAVHIHFPALGMDAPNWPTFMQMMVGLAGMCWTIMWQQDELLHYLLAQTGEPEDNDFLEGLANLLFSDEEE